MKPDTLITVPNGDLPITKHCKYLVLQDFWLKDICLRKGQIITDPVSKRWIELRLIKPYCECKQKRLEYTNVLTMDDEFESDVVSVTDAVDDSLNDNETVEPKKRRGRPSKASLQLTKS